MSFYNKFHQFSELKLITKLTVKGVKCSLAPLWINYSYYLPKFSSKTWCNVPHFQVLHSFFGGTCRLLGIVLAHVLEGYLLLLWMLLFLFQLYFLITYYTYMKSFVVSSSVFSQQIYEELTDLMSDSLHSSKDIINHHLEVLAVTFFCSNGDLNISFPSPTILL